MGHQQLSWIGSHWKHRDSHGGVLRNKRTGRGSRPITRRDPLHLVFKADRSRLRERSFRGYRSFKLTQRIIKRWARYFFVKIEHISIQGDHIHILVRCPRRAQFHHFFRVVSGQIAQVFEKEGLLRASVGTTTREVTDTPTRIVRRGTSLWKYRPFTRIVRGRIGFKIVRDYIQLNEKEALGVIKYNSRRLKGLSPAEWQRLWA